MATQKYKTLRRYEHPNHARLFTFSTYNRVRVLSRPRVAALVLGATGRACVQHRWDVLAYVVMPDHVHLLARPRENEPNASKFLFAIKRPVSYQMKQMLQGSDAPLLDRLTVTTGRSPGFRLWQAGGGHDRNLTSPETILASIEYIHANPVRAGLCPSPGDWAWSSYAQWMAPGDPVPPGLPVIARDRVR
ncbi:MAG: transposase [Phycisphaeraceae bacterium]|nr:MAG: transposase [Phycisphaeraceae bacterium]